MADGTASPTANGTVRIKPFEGTMAEALTAFKGYTPVIPAEHFSPVTELKKKPLIAPVKMANTNILYVFDALLSSGDFITEYHEKRNDTDVRVSDWGYSPGGGEDSPCGIRTMVCTTTVMAPFSKQTVLNESQRYVMWEESGKKYLALHCSSQTPDVTMGGYFRVEVMVEFTESESTVTMHTYSFINFIKSVGFLKGKIESSASAELSKSFTTFSELATHWVAERGAKAGKKKVKRKRSHDGTTGAPKPLIVQAPPQSSSFDTIMMVGAISLLVIVLLVLWMTVSSINTASDRLGTQRQSLLTEPPPPIMTEIPSEFPPRQQPIINQGTPHSPQHLKRPPPIRIQNPPPSPTKRAPSTPPLEDSPSSSPLSGSGLSQEELYILLQHVNELRANVDSLSSQINSQGWSVWVMSMLLLVLAVVQILGMK
jgi:hypothetical protein